MIKETSGNKQPDLHLVVGEKTLSELRSTFAIKKGPNTPRLQPFSRTSTSHTTEEPDSVNSTQLSKSNRSHSEHFEHLNCCRLKSRKQGRQKEE